MDATALKKRLEYYGIRPSARQLEQLWIFHELLREANPRLNMTRIHNFETMVRKHYVDSLIVGPMIEAELGGMPESMLDFGTGAGFPGVPLAIFYPRIRMILNESRANRAEFLREVVTRCGLENASVLGQRLVPDAGISVKAVILRAVGSMRKILERTHFALEKNGSLIFLKGPNCSSEIEEMKGVRAAKLTADLPYTLPHSEDHRRLVIFQVRSQASEVIRSESNERFQLYASLQTSKGIKKSGLAIVSGARLVKEALALGIVESLIRDEADAAEPAFARFTVLSSALFEKVDALGTGSPLAVIRAAAPGAIDKVPSGPCFVAPFQDPENLGAALRAGVAFGLPVILTQESANPFLPRAIRASAGAVMTAVMFRGGALPEVLEDLRNAGKTIVILRSDNGKAESLPGFKWPAETALVAGVEGPGVPAGIIGMSVHIPIEPGVESLNAAVALGIGLYEMRRASYLRST
jgi:16S rRNA (guanine(527)-N(7))-methyltransferase RsmG